MAWPIVSSSLTTVAAFLPLMLLPGTIGKFLAGHTPDGHHRPARLHPGGHPLHPLPCRRVAGRGSDSAQAGPLPAHPPGLRALRRSDCTAGGSSWSWASAVVTVAIFADGALHPAGPVQRRGLHPLLHRPGPAHGREPRKDRADHPGLRGAHPAPEGQRARWPTSSPPSDSAPDGSGGTSAGNVGQIVVDLTELKEGRKRSVTAVMDEVKRMTSPTSRGRRR
ncbi:MAG: hypothetical protein MZV70_35140 [Desulfobacterales bacterium]|nr:hypothetical protein [Desulfobacterales bacterium]